MMSTACSSWQTKLPIRPSTEPAMVVTAAPLIQGPHAIGPKVKMWRGRCGKRVRERPLRGRSQRGRRVQRRERRAAQAAAARARRAAAAREALVARAAPSSSPGSDRPGGPDLSCGPTGWTASLHPPLPLAPILSSAESPSCPRPHLLHPHLTGLCPGCCRAYRRI